MIIELTTTCVVIAFTAVALFRTYKTLKAQRNADAFGMDETFATHVPPWDEGTTAIDPDVAQQNTQDWSDYWFRDDDVRYIKGL